MQQIKGAYSGRDAAFDYQQAQDTGYYSDELLAFQAEQRAARFDDRNLIDQQDVAKWRDVIRDQDRRVHLLSNTVRSSDHYLALAQEAVAEQYPFIIYPVTIPKRLAPGTIIGSFAYSLPSKYRIMLDKSVELSPGVLPGDLVRAWLRADYKLPFRRRKNQLVRTYTLPIYAKRGDNFGECAYVDIKAAYLNVLRLGYDVEYRFGKYLAATFNPVPIEVANNKLAYSIAVAMSNSKRSALTIINKEAEPFSIDKFNMYSNPCIYSLASDLLNAIASEILDVLRHHVHYINTDGYICDIRYAEKAIEIVRSWGLQARIKHSGSTIIGGVASWKIGQAETKRFDAHARDFSCSMMSKDERQFLKRNWIKFAAHLETLSV